MLAGLSLLVLVFFLVARKAKPATNKTGNGIALPMKQYEQADTLTVATYNIQTGKSLQGKRNIMRSAEVIKQADIVGVQEVYAATWLNRLGVGMSQTQALAQNGNFGSLFAATRRRWFREHRGNALLTRLPVTQWQIKMLPDYTCKSYRNMTIIQFTFQGQDCCLINTHLHTKQGREQQLEVVLKEFARYSKVILLGDFNSTIAESQLQAVLSNVDIKDAISIGSGVPDDGQRIDWILVKGFDVVDAVMLDKGVSDHPYYQVILK